MAVITDPQKIHEFLFRGVEAIIPTREMVHERLMSGEIMKVYLGIDPTAPTLHIGHAIALKKLAQLQSLGHKIILLMGDFTARIGDPTDKMATRKTLTADEIAGNLKNYKYQAEKIISFQGENPAEIAFNNDWLGNMSFADVLTLCSKATVQQLLERDMFQERIKEGKPIYVHEMLYPLMQGCDSVAMMVDGEIGGNDQLFNMLVGRDLLKESGKDKFVMTVKLLVDSSGKKMGKSEGNMITLDDSADEMFGKILSWTDGMIVGGFELCTDVSTEDILQIELAMQNGENPMQYKKQLAREIVTLYHNAAEAVSAQENWEKTFSAGGLPEVISEVVVAQGSLLVDVLLENSVVTSKSDFRRLVDEGAIKIMTESGEEKITEHAYAIDEVVVIKVGKRKFLKIIV